MTDILEGNSTGEIIFQDPSGITNEVVEYIENKLMKVKPLQKEDHFKQVELQLDKAKQSMIESAICKFKSEDFNNNIWEQDYLIH